VAFTPPEVPRLDRQLIFRSRVFSRSPTGAFLDRAGRALHRPSRPVAALVEAGRLGPGNTLHLTRASDLSLELGEGGEQVHGQRADRSANSCIDPPLNEFEPDASLLELVSDSLGVMNGS
jgi:hypothetical protein